MLNNEQREKEQLGLEEVAQEELVESIVEVIPAKPHKVFLWWQHILFFVIGYLGMNLFAELLSNFNYFANLNNTPAGLFAATLFNLLVYLVTFTILAIVLLYTQAFVPVFKSFAKLKPYISGIFYGFLVIIASVSYSSLVTIIFGPTDSNLNQLSIEAMIKGSPVLNFLWIVILGPIVEELLYRVGLFNGLKKINRILAYVVSGIIFGFIHFNIPAGADGSIDRAKLIVELINIPSYIISGLLFAYIYEKEGFATSAVAHIMNNLLSFITTVIRSTNG